MVFDVGPGVPALRRRGGVGGGRDGGRAWQGAPPGWRTAGEGCWAGTGVRASDAHQRDSLPIPLQVEKGKWERKAFAEGFEVPATPSSIVK